MNPPKTIQSLQLLRGLAVTLVIVAHAIDSAAIFGHNYIASFYHFENFGAIGVDIFFVISGVIMTVITADKSITAKQFFLRRCTRILPLYWAISIFCWIISFTPFWPPVKFAEILETITVVPLFTSGYNAGPIIFLGWTLAFEFYFYLAFTAALFFTKKRPYIPVSIALFVFVIAGFVFPHNTEVHFKFLSNPIILEFLLGCICGHLYLGTVKIPNGVIYICIVTGIALMLYSIIYGFGNISEEGYTWNGSLSFTRVIKWGIPSFLLVTGLVLLEKNNRLKVTPLLITIGNLSYSAYLSHIFCIMFAAALWRRSGIGIPELFIVIAVIFSLAIAYLIYKFIEKPVTAYLNKSR